MTNLIKYITLIGFTSFFIISCNKTLQVTEVKSNNQEVSTTIATDPTAEKLIKPYRDSLKAKMDEVLNQTLVDLEVGSPEGLLGDFVCDLTFSRIKKEGNFQPDFCILNNGGLRTSIQKGDITLGKVYELMPFENEIVVVEISPEKMLELIEYVRKKSLEEASRKAGVPVSNFRMILNNGEVTNVMINNRQWDKNKSYKVVTTDYLSGGGDNMTFFLNPISIQKTGIKLRDAIIDNLVDLKQKGLPVNLALDGRIYHAE